MRIDIHAKRVVVDQSLRAHIERRIGSAVGRFDEFIGGVAVDLSGISGARGTAETICRIRVNVIRWGEVEVTESDVEVYPVVDRAAGRVGLAVIGELRRQRESTTRGRRISDE